MDAQLEAAAAALARHASAVPSRQSDNRQWAFEELPSPACLPGPVAAVDGSHAVLSDNGAVWIGATRAAAVPWPRPAPTAAPAPRIHVATPAEAQAQLDARYAMLGLESVRAASAEAWLEALRGLDELDAALAAAGALPSGGLLLIDGALRGIPRQPQAIADRIRAAAEGRGVAVIGVAKRSGLESGGHPLVPLLQRTGPPGRWLVEVEGGDGPAGAAVRTYVARLHPRSLHAFRIDAQDAAAVARLVSMSRDAAYCGYPYPLALAHNAVALTASDVGDLRSSLDAALRRHGAPVASLVADFHAVLDRNVPR
jgi:hypothetical protein